MVTCDAIQQPAEQCGSLYLHAVEGYGGCPVDLVTDLGTEKLNDERKLGLYLSLLISLV